MMNEIRVLGYTTKDISDPVTAPAFAALLTDRIGPVEVPDPRSTADKWVSFQSVEEADIVAIYLTKTFSIRAVSPDRRSRVSASLQWNKFDSQQEFEEFAVAAGYQQNSVLLTVEEEVEVSPSGHSEILRLFVAVANLFEVNYMFAIDFRGRDFDYRFDTASGIGVGLKDIYPLNFFGPAFVSLIGAETLLRLPAEVTEQHGESVLVVPLRDFLAYDLEQFTELREHIRKHIGAQFFANMKPAPASEVGCVLSLPLILWRDSRRFRDEKGAASSRPMFDWSDLWS